MFSREALEKVNKEFQICNNFTDTNKKAKYQNAVGLILGS